MLALWTADNDQIGAPGARREHQLEKRFANAHFVIHGPAAVCASANHLLEISARSHHALVERSVPPAQSRATLEKMARLNDVD
jgi:uncharacterized protein (DUF2345 family)